MWTLGNCEISVAYCRVAVTHSDHTLGSNYNYFPCVHFMLGKEIMFFFDIFNNLLVLTFKEKKHTRQITWLIVTRVERGYETFGVVADPGFPFGGDTNPMGYCCSMRVLFVENVCENERIGSHWGRRHALGHAPGTPLDPPMNWWRLSWADS